MTMAYLAGFDQNLCSVFDRGMRFILEIIREFPSYVSKGIKKA